MIDLENPNARQDTINVFLELQERAMKKRLEYLTVDIMPESPLKTLKLAKIDIERLEMENEFAWLVNEMVSVFWYEVLQDLI